MGGGRDMVVGGRDERLARLVARCTALLAVATGIAMVLSGCSNDGDQAADATTTTSTTDTTAATGGDDGATDEAVTDTGVTDEGEVGEPVALDAPADFGGGVTARLTEIEAVTVEGRLPGERSGPGVAITVEITNDSGAPIDLSLVTVDLVDAAGASASPITSSEAPGVSGELAAGAATTGRYLYTLSADDRADATVRVSYTASAPTVLFTGNLPNA
jgi:hypothetical protein